MKTWQLAYAIAAGAVLVVIGWIVAIWMFPAAEDAVWTILACIATAGVVFGIISLEGPALRAAARLLPLRYQAPPASSRIRRVVSSALAVVGVSCGTAFIAILELFVYAPSRVEPVMVCANAQSEPELHRWGYATSLVPKGYKVGRYREQVFHVDGFAAGEDMSSLFTERTLMVRGVDIALPPRCSTLFNTDKQRGQLTKAAYAVLEESARLVLVGKEPAEEVARDALVRIASEASVLDIEVRWIAFTGKYHERYKP